MRQKDNELVDFRNYVENELREIWEFPPSMGLQEQDMGPLEVYNYYLGHYINHIMKKVKQTKTIF